MEPPPPTPDALSAGVEKIYTPPDLATKLASGKKLRVKLGMDPTAPDLHLGHAVVLRKLRQFQDLGHTAVLIIGDYTARIGDPTGRDTTRPVLDETTVEKNAATYLDQASKILDTSPDKLELHRNSAWLSKLHLADLLRLTSLVTVQQMLHRENFKRRIENQTEILISEFLYPLMQGYDSVAILADVELGGTDQTFNNLIGRDLMAKHHLPPQVVMVLPILPGTDGHEKMSKTRGNAISLTDPPADMFGKIMSIPDAAMPAFFNLLTSLPDNCVASLLNPHHTNPRDAKDVLASILVETFHDAPAAAAASREFRHRFSQGQLPTDLEVRRVPASPIPILDLIHHVGFASSKSEARRLVEQGAVSLDGQKITDPKAQVAITNQPVLKVGKLRVCKVEVAP